MPDHREKFRRWLETGEKEKYQLLEKETFHRGTSQERYLVAEVEFLVEIRQLPIGYADSMSDLMKMWEAGDQVQLSMLSYSKAGSPIFKSTVPVYYVITH